MNTFKSSLKKLDLFSLPVHTFMVSHNNKHSKKKSYDMYKGSLPSAILTICMVTIIFSYVLAVTINVSSKQEDNIQSYTLYNNHE